MPLPGPLHHCSVCGQETGCTQHGASWICGRASCLMRIMWAALDKPDPRL